MLCETACRAQAEMLLWPAQSLHPGDHPGRHPVENLCSPVLEGKSKPVGAGAGATHQQDKDKEQDHAAAEATARRPPAKAKAVLEKVKEGRNKRQPQKPTQTTRSSIHVKTTPFVLPALAGLQEKTPGAVVVPLTLYAENRCRLRASMTFDRERINCRTENFAPMPCAFGCTHHSLVGDIDSIPGSNQPHGGRLCTSEFQFYNYFEGGQTSC